MTRGAILLKEAMLLKCFQSVNMFSDWLRNLELRNCRLQLYTVTSNYGSTVATINKDARGIVCSILDRTHFSSRLNSEVDLSSGDLNSQSILARMWIGSGQARKIEIYIARNKLVTSNIERSRRGSRAYGRRSHYDADP